MLRKPSGWDYINSYFLLLQNHRFYKCQSWYRENCHRSIYKRKINSYPTKTGNKFIINIKHKILNGRDPNCTLNLFYRLGLADKILESGSVEEAENWISLLISHDCHVTSLVKKVVDKVGQVGIIEALDHEKRLFASVWGGEANKKALDGKLKH